MKMTGLQQQEVAERRRKYGSNVLTRILPEPAWKKFCVGLVSPMILILLVALGIQLLLCCCGRAAWYEPLGVLATILLANGVSVWFEARQEERARILREKAESAEQIKVLRDGRISLIPIGEVVTGDIVRLQAGDLVPADGVLAEGELQLDQSALNGESEEAGKRPLPAGTEYDKADLLNPYRLYRGTIVVSGEGVLQVETVGDATEYGKAALAAQEPPRQTPLQWKLEHLAKQISLLGYYGGAGIVLVILLKSFLGAEAPGDFLGWCTLFLEAVTIAVTILVCAVPEGLPMLTSILQALQGLKMAKDHVLVRKINGMETAGSLNVLFSDKTGTLTEGRLSLAEMVWGDLSPVPEWSRLSPACRSALRAGIGRNNSAMPSAGGAVGGNATDRALLNWLLQRENPEMMCADRVWNFSPFDSVKKSSSITVSEAGRVRTYLKGAPELILARCTGWLDEEGQVREGLSQAALTEYLNVQAARAMRLLAVARCEGEMPEGPMTLVCLIAIRDQVRKEVGDAVRELHQAGVQLVVVTGDRRETAQAIARECGILAKEQDLCLTSQELAMLSDGELRRRLPDLRVVARSLPLDKSRLVRLAQERELVAGMTGDGVNDAPALRKADVGFAMGSGTEAAKAAGDITILDDNLFSVRTAILYGRSMFKSLRKFLVFQLTVNVAAVLICLTGPLLGYPKVLTVLQLLLVNLVMDTLAAIAFGAEPPLPEYLREKPVPRKEPLVTRSMRHQILLGSLWISAVCLGMLFFPWFQKWLGVATAGKEHAALLSAIFAVFMMMITFNGWNIRTSGFHLLRGCGKNPVFLCVMCGILVLQYCFVTFGGRVLEVQALPLETWGKCLLLSLTVFPMDFLRKIFIRKRSWDVEKR